MEIIIRCCECGRVLNNQTDECFVLENGDVICEDCIDYQIYTEEMEWKTVRGAFLANRIKRGELFVWEQEGKQQSIVSSLEKKRIWKMGSNCKKCAFYGNKRCKAKNCRKGVFLNGLLLSFRVLGEGLVFLLIIATIYIALIVLQGA